MHANPLCLNTFKALIGMAFIFWSVQSSAHAKVDQNREFNHDIRCDIAADVGHWNRGSVKIISGMIENLTDHPLELKVDAVVYLTPSRSGETGEEIWAPVDLFHEGFAKTEKRDLGPAGKAVTAQPSPMVLQFKNRGERIRFRVDAGQLLWAKAISSMWPSQELFNLIKSGDYDLKLVLETSNARVESAIAKISINAANLGTKRESYEAEERDYWAHQIPKVTFPNAPEKTKRVDCFRAFTPESSVDMVVKKCGRPDEEVGSGISIFLWHMPDGSTISIGTPHLERIGEIRYTDRKGKTSFLVGAK